MKTEIEAKFLVQDFQNVRKRLLKVGGRLIHPDTLMRRHVFDFPDHRLEKVGGWVRVRDEGHQITMSYKQLEDRTLHGTKETTMVVDTFDSACEFLKDIGLVDQAYQETRRETWEYHGGEITLDQWPWIPPFVEIEAPDEDGVHAAAKALEFSWADALHGSVENVYTRLYDVTEAEVDAWPKISFIPVPDWLEQKRR